VLLRLLVAPRSAGALNPGEPIEKPQADRSGYIENHFPDLDFDFTIWSACRGHHVSFSGRNKNACE
jgi:hypothetical protein